MGEITRVVLFGDSHTIGYGTESRQSWAHYLEQYFYGCKDSCDRHFFYNLSKEGMTISGEYGAHQLAKSCLDSFLRDPFDPLPTRERSLSIVALGTNEASVRHTGKTDISLPNFERVLQSFTKFLMTRSTVLFIDFPLVSEEKMSESRGYPVKSQQESHRAFRRAIHENAKEMGVHSIQLPEIDCAEMTILDGVHLNSLGHRTVYDHVLPVFQSLIGYAPLGLACGTMDA